MIKILLYPVTIVWLTITISFIIIAESSRLFGDYYASITLLSETGRFWILAYVALFSLGAFTEALGGQLQPLSNSEQRVSPKEQIEFLEHAVIFFKLTSRIVTIFALIAFANALWRWVTVINSIGGLSNLGSMYAQGTQWRISVINTSHGFGVFMPSYSSTALLMYATSGYVLLWCAKKSLASEFLLRNQIESIQRRMIILGILAVGVSVATSMVLLARLSLLQAVVPSFVVAFIILQRLSLFPHATYTFLRDHWIRIIFITAIILFFFSSATNLRSTEDLSSLNTFSVSYFATNLYAADNTIQYFSHFALGRYSFGQFLQMLGLSNPIQDFDAYFAHSTFEYYLLSSQAWNSWRVVWVDFGPFGIIYTWILGFLSSFLYRRAWSSRSIYWIWWGGLVTSIWILNFHVFQAILIIFWWNVFLLVLLMLYEKALEGSPILNHIRK